MEAGDLDRGEYAADDERGGDEVLRQLAAQIGTTLTGEDDGRGDDLRNQIVVRLGERRRGRAYTCEHGEGVLEAEKQG